MERFDRVQSRTSYVKVGTTVTWIDHDDDPHSVGSPQGKFKSAALDTNDKFEFRFTEAGEYPFYCRFHPKMTGKIIVQPSSTGERAKLHPSQLGFMLKVLSPRFGRGRTFVTESIRAFAERIRRQEHLDDGWRSDYRIVPR